MSSFYGERFGEFERFVDLCKTFLHSKGKKKPNQAGVTEKKRPCHHSTGALTGMNQQWKINLKKTKQRNTFFPCSHQKVSWKCIIFTFKQKNLPFQWKILKLICTSMLNSAVKFTSHIPLCRSPLWMTWWQTWRSEIRALSLENCQKSDFSPDGTCNNPEVFQPSSTWLLFPLPSVAQLKSPSSAVPWWDYPKGFYLYSDTKLKAALITPPIKMILKNRRVLKAV